MKNWLALIFSFAQISLLTAFSNSGTKEIKKKIQFIENKGQVYDQYAKPHSEVLFSGSDGQYVFHIKSKGISYQLVNSESEITNKSTIYRVDLEWLGLNEKIATYVGQAVEGYSNYYLPSCSNGVFNVKAYEDVTLVNIYNNVNVRYYENNGRLKCDYIVAPNTDYQQIMIKVSGAEVEKTNSGNLILKTPFGIIEEAAPIAFQEGIKLEAEWVVNENIVSYHIKNYNKNKELIIDPMTRVWGTYYGDFGADYGYACQSDASDNVYLTGRTASWINIATNGAHQVSYGGGADAFLTKINANGIRVWSTYYGDVGNDYGQACTITNTGECYMAGITQSSIGISSAGSHQTTYGGGANDAFLIKFNNSGQRLWGTYYGGSADDQAYSCCIDTNNNVYLCGFTSSTNNISTTGAHQMVLAGGPGDEMLVKFNSNGQRLWGTYYGGTNNDIGYQCVTDPSGNIFLIGSTQSTNSISTSSAAQVLHGGDFDACITKFNNLGIVQWATYSGGAGIDHGYSCSVDPLGNIYLAGATQSTTNISTLGAHQVTLGGIQDAYLKKYSSSGILLWGTYYGGISDDLARSCKLDAFGNIYLAGQSLSINNISTAGAYQVNNAGGVYDVFLSQFNSSGVRQWGTFYGGAKADGAFGCAVDNTGSVYIAGYTDSQANIASALSHQTVFGGVYDAFLVKFANCTSASPSISVNSPACAGSTLNFNAIATSTLALNYFWYGPNSFSSTVQNPSLPNAQLVNSGTYTLVISDGFGCTEYASSTVTINTCTNIQELEAIHNLLYPNPNAGNINLDLEKDCALSIINSAGQEVFYGEFKIGRNKLNTQFLPSGIYLVRLRHDNLHEQRIKMIKE